MDKTEAHKRKQVYDNYKLAAESEFGKRLEKELVLIEAAAISETMKANQAVGFEKYLEARGRYQVVQKIRFIFREIENEYKEAVPILEAEVVESAPVDTTAPEVPRGKDK